MCALWLQVWTLLSVNIPPELELIQLVSDGEYIVQAGVSDLELYFGYMRASAIRWVFVCVCVYVCMYVWI